jgi:hypothetical protein
MMRLRRLFVVLLVTGSVALACGRKTVVKAPELVAPERIQSLSATNAPDGIRLTWARPVKYADGSRMYDLGSFRVERSTASGQFLPLATVEVTDRERLRQERHYGWVDADTVLGQTYQYRVISVTTDAYVSQPSNIVTLDRALPATAPPPTPPVR